MRRHYGPWAPLLLLVTIVAFEYPSIARADFLQQATGSTTSANTGFIDLSAALSQAASGTFNLPQSNVNSTGSVGGTFITPTASANSLSVIDTTSPVSNYQTPLSLTATTSTTQYSSPAPLGPSGGADDVNGAHTGLPAVPAPGGLVLVLCALPFLGYWWSQRRDRNCLAS
jgi:hypothetical protein